MAAKKKLDGEQRLKFVKRCPMTMTCAIMGVTKPAIYKWVNDGCPRNKDGSYPIDEVIAWRMAKETEKAVTPGGLSIEKLKAEIELKKAQVQKISNNFIERSLHETIMTSRAGSLRSFFEKTAVSNAVHLAGKNVDEVRTLLLKLFEGAMDAYIGDSANG